MQTRAFPSFSYIIFPAELLADVAGKFGCRIPHLLFGIPHSLRRVHDEVQTPLAMYAPPRSLDSTFT